MQRKEFVKERIKINSKIFTNKELRKIRKIRKNSNLITKIYLLGSMESVNAMLGGNV